MSTSLERELLHIPPRTGPAWWVGGETYIFKLTGADTEGAFSVYEAILPPQSGFPPHVHENESETCYILEGELEMCEGGQAQVARAGASIFVPRGNLHTFRNVSQSTTRLLFIAVPAGIENFFIEAGQPAQAGQPAPEFDAEQMECFRVVGPKYGLIFSVEE